MGAIGSGVVHGNGPPGRLDVQNMGGLVGGTRVPLVGRVGETVTGPGPWIGPCGVVTPGGWAVVTV